MNYYNEFDPAAAAWLRELIARKLIPDGIVDERSITEIHAPDLQDFTQCHFFAGIGGWSLALQLAGVAPDTRLWTGSCPCQPFSSAGKGEGKDDERHLWPVFFDLIKACRPPVVFGEQVASALVVGKAGGGHREEDGPVWLDGVFADLESAGYATGATVLGAHSVGAPHIRQRLYWVADATGTRHQGAGEGSSDDGDREDSLPQRGHALHEPSGSRTVVGMADATGEQSHGRGHARGGRGESSDGGDVRRLAYPPECRSEGQCGSRENRTPECGAVGGLGDIPSRGLGEFGNETRQGSGGHADGSGGASGRLAESRSLRHGECERDLGAVRGTGGSDEGEEPESRGPASEAVDHRADGGLAAPDGRDTGAEREQRSGEQRLQPGGHWSDSIWLPCRDGKHRRVPTQSVLQPVADGIPDLVGAGWGGLLEATPGLTEAAKGFPLASGDPFKLATRGTVRPALLKGAGNAIVPQDAALFIQAFYEVTQ